MKKKFKPRYGEVYWIINDEGSAGWSVWDGFPVDFNRFKFGNCFATEKEALAAAERVKKTLKGDSK